MNDVVNTNSSLRVFLCHSSSDKATVRRLYKYLVKWNIDAWLDDQKLIAGQNWRTEIQEAIRASHVVIVCLSRKSVTKEGYVQKEIRFALDTADEKPASTIYLIPARLEKCDVPKELSPWQYVDLYRKTGYGPLIKSLLLRANQLGIRLNELGYENQKPLPDNENYILMQKKLLKLGLDYMRITFDAGKASDIDIQKIVDIDDAMRVIYKTINENRPKDTLLPLVINALNICSATITLYSEPSGRRFYFQNLGALMRLLDDLIKELD